MNDFATRELADAALDLTGNKAFQAALAQLEKDRLSELLTQAPATERKLELIAELKALKALPQQLKLYVDKGRRAHG